MNIICILAIFSLNVHFLTTVLFFFFNRNKNVTCVLALGATILLQISCLRVIVLMANVTAFVWHHKCRVVWVYAWEQKLEAVSIHSIQVVTEEPLCPNKSKTAIQSKGTLVCNLCFQSYLNKIDNYKLASLQHYGSNELLDSIVVHIGNYLGPWR